MPDDRALLAKLAKIMALHEGAGTPGERAAAAAALDRVQQRLEQARGRDEAVEMQFSIHDANPESGQRTPWMAARTALTAGNTGG